MRRVIGNGWGNAAEETVITVATQRLHTFYSDPGCSCSCVREVLCAPVLLWKEGRWRFQRRVRAKDVEGS